MYPMTESARRLASRVILMPQDTNEVGSIFAGVILSYLDLAGAVEAEQYAPDVPNLPQPFVTAAMRAVTFTEPVFVGDLVSYYTRTVRRGRTSVTVHVEVEAQRAHDSGTTVRVTEADVTYVAIDRDRKPIAIRHPSPPRAGS